MNSPLPPFSDTAANSKDDTAEEKPLNDSENIATEDFEEDEQLLIKQKLKATIHFCVDSLIQKQKLSNEFPNGMQMSRRAIAALSELTFGFIENLGHDLECFSKHANRTTVKPDDVKLCVRRSVELHRKLTDYLNRLNPKSTSSKRKKTTNNNNPNDAGIMTTITTSTLETSGMPTEDDIDTNSDFQMSKTKRISL